MKIEKTINTPEIIFDKDKCELTFRGASYPENANNFYGPIKNDIIKCFEELNGVGKEVKIICEFTLLNSISTRYMYEFFKSANLYSHSNTPATIKWYYEYDDDDMGTDGQIFKETFKKLDFEIIPVKDIDNVGN